MNEDELYKMLNNFPQIEVVKYILEIQEENTNLGNTINEASTLLIKKNNKIDKLQQRIDKAIEYIENVKKIDSYLDGVLCDEILSILKGEE